MFLTTVATTLSYVISLILSCTCFEIVPSSTSPILSVPATVLKPSAARNIRSPPNSWIEWCAIVPTFLATSANAKLVDVVPVSL